MAIKYYKKEEDGKLEVGLNLYTKRFLLTVDRELCKGCELCKLACPTGCISSVETADSPDGKAQACTIDIYENRCDYHGICAVVCPFNAIKITLNGEESLPSIDKEAFPELIRDFTADVSKCEVGCKECEEACTLDIIKVKPRTESSEAEVDVEIDKCCGCRKCYSACPTDAIRVTKFIEGSTRINQAACPENCSRCADVCPVSAIQMQDGKAVPIERDCIYCGACKLVCPAEGALTVERTAVYHTPIVSGAWYKGLEKLTSAKGVAREITAERIKKTREAIMSLNVPKVGE
ncbi:MAG: 4Fe-4S binding protein [Eubacteriaceae bacterium]|nr:4Fe-4S binding protein [Eubacteriaceae bacterium]